MLNNFFCALKKVGCRKQVNSCVAKRQSLTSRYFDNYSAAYLVIVALNEVIRPCLLTFLKSIISFR